VATGAFFNGVRDWGCKRKSTATSTSTSTSKCGENGGGAGLDVCKATAQDVADHTMAVGQQAAPGLAAGICAKLSSAGACQ
jgi:hypothetical protein